MTRPFVICDPWSVVVVPFPLSADSEQFRRPALIISHRTFNEDGLSIAAMITAKREDEFLGDWEIQDLAAAGLPAPCRVRLKIFSIDSRLIIRCVGTLSAKDREGFVTNLSRALVTR